MGAGCPVVFPFMEGSGGVGQFRIVLDQLIGMGVMMVVGYICVRTRVLGQQALDGICALLLKVGIPLLVFCNAVNGTTRADLISAGAVIVMTMLMYALLIGLTTLISLIGLRAGHWELWRARMFRGCFSFGNAGFIGLPLVLALFPGKGALYFALMSIGDQLVLWTYGVWTCNRPEDRTSRADEHPARNLGQRLLGMVSPALVAVVVAVAIVLIGVPIPQDVLRPLASIGSVSTPLSMMYVGGLFALRSWAGVLRRGELYVGIAFKMLAFPLAFYALLAYVPPMVGLGALNADMVHMMTLISGLPSMSAVVMFAERERNHPEYAIGTVLVTTVASLLTLNVVSFVVF